MNTKELILKKALDMFAKLGYNAVSIRDIAKAVNIKESSIYYHFKNKQDILDSLVAKYESHIKGLIDKLQESMSELNVESKLSWDWLSEFYFEQYLFEPFCNQMMRFLMIEQFHNDNMGRLYDYYLFELPRKIQTESFMRLVLLGIMDEKQAEQTADLFFTNITSHTFRYLLNGELSQIKKDSFCKEVLTNISRIF